MFPPAALLQAASDKLKAAKFIKYVPYFFSISTAPFLSIRN
jgi:hypothetical protein